MKIIAPPDALQGQPMDATHFTGPVTSLPLHEALAPHPVRVSVVHFPANIRNDWHRHEGGQVLHVVDGEGYVQSRGEAARAIRAGDTVTVPAGEEHWHGASPHHAMAHIACSIGETVWLERTDPPPIG